LVRQNVIVDWFNRDIAAGQEREKEILEHLDAAHIILLLISPDFIASDYCYGIEMTRALERHETKDVCVIPVLLDAVDWQGTPFSKLQVLPKNAKSVRRWANRNDAFADVTKNIRETIKNLQLTSLASPSLTPEVSENQNIVSTPGEAVPA